MTSFESGERMPRSFVRRLLGSAALLAAGAMSASVLAQEGVTATVVQPPAAPMAVLVELTGEAATRTYAAAYDSTRAVGRQAATNAAVNAARAQVARNRDEQQRFLNAMVSKGINATSLYRATKAVNGLAYLIDNTMTLEQLKLLPGVKTVHVIQQELPSLSTSVPFIGAPTAWSGANPLGVTGQGVKVGIIDTGVDYQHATFGGTGLLADYQANDRTVAPDAYFPTARVVGGTDFAGDAYTGSNAPAPDSDPMDCNGHGTHVASTAAGGGVNSDGSPYTGVYDTTTPFASMRLGPGVAPQASVYALRVFGCTGSTTLTVAAIDWAVDPNNDDDLSDHLDVINMSLGSNYGSLASTSAIAADNAARMGVIVVASAGNAGDTYTISGSPGSGQRVIATAAVGDNGLPGVYVTVNAPALIAGNYPAGASSMVDGSNTPTAAAAGQTGDVVQALDASNASGPLTTDACTAITNAAAVAGKIAIVDRGTCGFAIKYQNVLAAGAIGMIVADNAAGAPLGISGTVVGPVTIPAARVSQADGNAIKARLTAGDTVNLTFQGGTLADTLAGFSSRGPRGGGAFTGVKPDLAAPGLAITAAQTGVTCLAGNCQTPDASGYRAGSQNLVLQGTSMAAPHAAGMMALLKQRLPDLSVEEMKAIAMNTALHNVYQFAGNINRIGVDRSGAGRIDPVKALQSTVAAFNADEPGAVNLAFFGEVVGTLTQSKRIRVVNYGSTAQTFTLGIDIANDAPGISFSLPSGSSVTVPAGGTVFVDVQVDGNAATMDHVRDVSADATQAAPAPLTSLGNLPRHFLTNKSGYVTFSQGANVVLRTPVYAAMRPASNMAAASSIVTGGAPTGSTTIPLSGQDVCTGTLGAGPTCTGTFPTDDVSLVSPFELQVRAPANNTIPASANIKDVGIAYDGSRIQFGVSTWGDWGSPTETTFNIYIDTNNDGTWDRILFNSNPGTLSSSLFGGTGTGQDTFLTAVFNIATSGVATQQFVNVLSAAGANSVLFGTNAMILAATPASLGITPGTPFRYKVVTCPGFAPLCKQISGFQYDEVVGPFSWNTGAQGLNFGNSALTFDLNGATVPVTWNTANMTANGSLGAMLIHHHNAAGKRVQVVPLDNAGSADLAVTQSLTPPSPTQGQNVTIALTATNNGGSNATGVTVNAPLPAGLTYVSDTGAGAYAGGVWTVGALNNGASASLSIVAQVTGSGPITMASQISGSPTDPVTGNNTASNTITIAAQTAAALTNTLTTANPVLVGGSSSFTITVKNTGVDTLFNVAVNASRSPAATITGSTASTGSFNNGTGVWSIPSLASGVTATLTITVTAPNTIGALTVTADVTADNAPATQQVASVNVISPAAVTATKTVAGTFTSGGTVTYTVTLSNSAATAQFDNPGAEFTDVLPAGLTLVSASASSGTATATVGTNTVTWNGSIAGNGSVTITINATVNAGTQGSTISNQGGVAFDADGNGTNEASALTDDPGVAGASNPTSFVVQFAGVSATKTVALTGTQVGSTATYTIVLSNAGNTATLDNAGDELTDVLPLGLDLVSASATAGTATANIATRTVTWNGSIPAAGSVTITIVTRINAVAPGNTISNQASFAYDADLNGTNESTGVTDDPTVAGAANATAFDVAALVVPTLSTIALIALMLLMLLWGASTLRQTRRR